MPTYKSVREILNSLYQDANTINHFDPVIANNSIDSALRQISELIGREKEGKIYGTEGMSAEMITEITANTYLTGWNACIEHLQGIIEGKK